ncbi:MAG TPA: DUF3455 domain-containing protein [Tepidisphaeraceae bacterium]|jgi:hypothetical protein
MRSDATVRVVLVWLGVLVSGCANRPSQNVVQIEGPNGRISAPSVPPGLRVNGSPTLQVHASGVQIYTLTSGPGGTASWKLKAPDATFSGPGVQGRHYAGPTWESMTDGSKVVGRKLAEVASPDPNAVGWLLLEAKSHEGNGVLSNVTFIQRINTVGGMAPTTAGATPGDEVKVPYQAIYVFYGAGATTRPTPN